MEIQNKKPYIIGVSGRSGSGKTSFVRNVRRHFGSDLVSIHTLDNYYRKRTDQKIDEKGYANFDLPESFYEDQFAQDLKTLLRGEHLLLRQYHYNCEHSSDTIEIRSTPIIFVEGLFIYHFEEVQCLLNYRIMIALSQKLCYSRRLRRDIEERNYEEEEIRHRYFQHVEPAFHSFIKPYEKSMDLIVDNTMSLEEGVIAVKQIIHKILQ